jgi:hypothetical protein
LRARMPLARASSGMPSDLQGSWADKCRVCSALQQRVSSCRVVWCGVVWERSKRWNRQSSWTSSQLLISSPRNTHQRRCSRAEPPSKAHNSLKHSRAVAICRAKQPPRRGHSLLYPISTSLDSCNDYYRRGKYGDFVKLSRTPYERFGLLCNWHAWRREEELPMGWWAKVCRRFPSVVRVPV